MLNQLFINKNEWIKRLQNEICNNLEKYSICDQNSIKNRESLKTWSIKYNFRERAITNIAIVINIKGV